MPTYSYRCTECDNAFDIHQAFTEDSLTVCPSCGGVLRKVFSPIGVTFSGSGFYRTDSRAAQSSSSPASGSGGSSNGGSSSGSSAGGSSAGGSGGEGSSGSSGSGSSGSGSSGNAPATPAKKPSTPAAAAAS